MRAFCCPRVRARAIVCALDVCAKTRAFVRVKEKREAKDMELGSTVHLLYTGTLADGTVFGYAREDEPMVFQTGMELTVPGFEREVMQMRAGEKKTFTLGIYDAYGEYLDELEQTVPRQNVPVDVEVGKRVWMTAPNGDRVPVTVKSVDRDDVVFDMNHPLAGKELTFEVEVLEVEEPPENFVSAAEQRKRDEQIGKQYDMGEGEGSGTVVL